MAGKKTKSKFIPQTDTLAYFVFLYILATVAGAVSGIFDARLSMSQPCKRQAARVEYVFPGYQIGCWLGEVP